MKQPDEDREQDAREYTEELGREALGLPKQGYDWCQRCGDDTWRIDMCQCEKCGFVD